MARVFPTPSDPVASLKRHRTEAFPDSPSKTHSRNIPEKLLLLWIKEHVPKYRPLSFNVLREVCTYLPLWIVLPCISGETLRLYDLQCDRMERKSLSLCFSYGTMFCMGEGWTVLCIGGSNRARVVSELAHVEDFAKRTVVETTYALSLITCDIAQLQDMRSARGHFALIKYRDVVYVFGGYGTAETVLSACEKFNLSSEVWTPIPDMLSPKDRFSACLYKEDIYLTKFPRLEVFNVYEERFKLVRVKHLYTGVSSIATIVEDELVVLTLDQYASFWQIGSEDDAITTPASVMSQGSFMACNTPLTTLGRNVYWAEYASGRMHYFNLDSKTIWMKDD